MEIDSDDTYDDYSIEFDDEEPPKKTSETTDANSKVRKKPGPPKVSTYVPRRKNKGYSTGLSCRVCLKKCKKQSREANEFADIYLKCTGFSIEEGQTKIIRKICYPCMNELLKVENFIDKCSATEEKLSKGYVPKEWWEGGDEKDDDEQDCDEKDGVEKEGGVSDISDVDVVIEGEDFSSDHSNFSDTLKKPKQKKEVVKSNVEKPIEIKIPKTRGRPPLSPSQRKVKPKPRGRVGRPPGYSPKIKIGRPRGSLNIKKDDSTLDLFTSPNNPSGEHKVEREDGSQGTEVERQICFVCGKLVRVKQLAYHIWKHRKDEQEGKIEKKQHLPRCEYCDKFYKTEELKKNHMKRIHPGVVYGMPSEKTASPEPQSEDDDFEKEFQVPPKDDYAQIMSPYDHTQALHNLQRNARR